MTTSEASSKTGTSAVRGIDIAVHLTHDPQRALAFYRDVLGMTPSFVDEEGRGAEFELADGTTFGIWKPDEGTPTGATLMFAVENAAQAVADFRARGAKLSDIEETPVCFMSFGADPDGTSYFIHQRKTAG